MTFDQQYAIIVQLLQWYVFQWLALYTLHQNNTLHCYVFEQYTANLNN